MRTIDATLLANQDTLHGKPCLQLVIGTAPDTIDISSYVLSYDYREIVGAEGGLTIVLDNKDGYFNTLTGDKANITEGAEIELKRGRTISGSDYVEELPTTWIETATYQYIGGTSTFILECVDWRGLLDRWSPSTDQEWSSTSTTTILEWILTQVGLTRLAGSMTALTLDFAIRLREAGDTALNRLMRKMPEYLYPGQDGEIKWKNIDVGDASVYTFGWNANHPLLQVEGGWGAWEVNSITVKGRSSATGTASNATQITKCGTRKCTIHDDNLTTNAQCAQSAQADLDIYEAGATALGILICRPCHGLELLDVVTVDSPPWGGANLVGRVIRYTEEWNHDGRWHQTINLGETPEKDPGNEPAKKKRTKGRRKRRHRKRPRPRPRPPTIEERLDLLLPIGSIIMWSGATVPANWALCDGTDGTPDLSGRFIVASGGGYGIGDTGGEDANDLAHTHGPGTLNTASDAHTHGPGTLNTDNDSHDHAVDGGETASNAHTHAPGSLHTAADTHDHDVDAGATASDAHTHSVTGDTGLGGDHSHTPGTLATGTASTDDHQDIVDATGPNTSERAHTHNVTSGATGTEPRHTHGQGTLAAASDAHTHGPGTLNTANDTHDHEVDGGATASDSHSHGPGTLNTASDAHDHNVDSGVTASDSHDHDVDSGVTASAGSAAQENRPAYYALALIMRIA